MNTITNSRATTSHTVPRRGRRHRSRTTTGLAGGFSLIQDDRRRGVGRLYTRGLERLSVCQRCNETREIKGRRTLSSSNTPRRILVRMSRAAVSNAASTLSPLLALASTKSSPSSCAHRSPSSVDTCLRSRGRSLLLPTRMHVKCGSACVRTSVSQVRACSKPIVWEPPHQLTSALVSGGGRTEARSHVVNE